MVSRELKLKKKREEPFEEIELKRQDGYWDKVYWLVSRDAGQVVFIKDGEIVNRGTHQSLLDKRACIT